ncbi:MAG: alpha/beta fold hydrolase [Actinophytocola sp.]|nr:alpha/beta fold hydrolase [Actinophytocola sp.]
MTTEITFTSHGVRCAAWHLKARTDLLADAAGRPCVVMAHGFGGTRDAGLLGYATAFAHAGIDVFVFDYRGFGDSEGTPRQDVSVRRQRQDYHAAIAAARHQVGVDPDRIVLWGTSYSAGHAIAVAAQDGRIAAVVAMTPAMDGLATLAHIARSGEVGRLMRLIKHGLRDVARALTKRAPHELPIVGPPGSEAMIPTPDSEQICAWLAGPTWRNEVCARAALAVGLNRPTTFARRMACPVLTQVGTNDTVAPPAAARRAARKSGAQLREYPVDHFDVYQGPWQQRMLADQLDFLRNALAWNETTRTLSSKGDGMSRYDYVIVGAGSAGSVLAARLSEDPDVQVALIEAGGPDTAQEVHIPAAFPQLFKSDVDWDLDSDPEPGIGGRRAYLPRGKVFGGCSSMNAMIYIRGNRADYDGWSAAGATGWSYDDVLPYFRRSEDNQRNQRGEDDFHGVGGPLTVSDGRSLHPLASAFVDAAEQAGHKTNDDFNGETQFGVGRYQLTQRDGMRCSASVAYLHPAMKRPNLTVLPASRAHRVVIEDGRATGVEVERGGAVEVVRAEREVILSAGAYESPKLLMLSGIGPAASLSAFGIDVVRDLPVGQGLQDHYMTLLNFRTDVESLLSAASPENAALLQREGRGPLTSNIGEAGGFFRSRDGLDAPDLQFHAAPVLFHQEGLGAPTEHGFAFGPCVLAPTSRGAVTLRSPLPDAAPRILHNYLTTSEDRACIVAGIRIAREIAAQRAVADVVTGPYDVPASDSDADLLAWAQRTGQTLYHPTSTCAIGAVVDPELRVFDVAGLRVVDASVFPAVPRGNANAPTIMAAEKAADLITGAAR